MIDIFVNTFIVWLDLLSHILIKFIIYLEIIN